MQLQHLWGVALAGAVGAMARYSLHMWATRTWGERFPWGTLLVNVIGCIVLGFVVELVWRSTMTSPWLRIYVPVGLLGGFTTFSTFSYETLRHLEQGEWGTAAISILANVGFGLLATALGFWAARSLMATP